MKTLCAAAASLLLASSAFAAGLSTEGKAYLDAECAKAARAHRDAPCAGVANATLFSMMTHPKHKEEASRPELGDEIKATCARACEAARKGR